MNVLLVINKLWWESKCPPFWPEQYNALRNHPDVRIETTGTGWSNWDQKASLRSNVENLMPTADVVYLWRPFGIAEFPGIIGGEGRLRQLKVSAYQDDPRNGVLEAKRAGLDLLFYHDHWDRQFFQGGGIRSVYLPLAVNLELYTNHDRFMHERHIPVILTGNRNPKVYPLRVRYSRLMSLGRIVGRIRQTPGYRLPRIESVFKEQRQYAASLMSSKISIVSTCPYIPLTLRKYFESMAAGCVIVGDMPNSPPDDIKGCINVVSAKDSDDVLVSAIKRLLNSPDELERQRIRNRRVAEAYGYKQFADRWVEAVTESLEMKR